jgi:predicted AAA+ superfamily ATPase
MITGPRAAGKTTTAARHAVGIARLDRPREAVPFQADPDAALSAYEEPILLDEWQEVASVLGAVKRAVDRDPRPGRFILTGSVRADLETATWPGTGRVVRMPMYGMTVRELDGEAGGPSFLDRLVSGAGMSVGDDPPDLRGYVELALRSGFPDAAMASGQRARQRWLEGYVDQLLTRDALGIDQRRDPARLRRYLEAYALNSAGVVSDATLLRAAGVNRRTAVAYEQLLANMFVVEPMPAWTSNRLRRLSLNPKRYFVEPGIPAAALGLDASAVLRDGDLLGRLLDTFVAAQLRAECTSTETRPRLYHLREEHGRREVDVLAEIGGREVLAFEVKAAAAPSRDAAKHLVWLRDRLGERFLGGIVFHTGPALLELDERVTAAPIAVLWS